MEKPSEGECVGSIPFDYSLLSDSGRASDAGSDVPAVDLNEKPELEILQAQVPEQAIRQENKQFETKLTPLLLPLDDATPIPGCKGLLNRKEVRATALRLINERFPSSRGMLINRVSEKFIDRLEIAVQTEMVAAIKRHPSPVVSPTLKEYPWTQKITQNSNTPPTVPPP